MRRERKKAGNNDRRRGTRWRLVFYLRVFDGRNADILGHLADISSKGLKLISEAPMSLNQEYLLRVRLPKEMAGRIEIVVEAKSRWCKKDANPDFHITGFRFINPDNDTKKSIKRLIEEFSIDEHSATNDSEHPACTLTHTANR